MCLVTVYLNYHDQQKTVMQDVAQMEAQDGGFLLVDLLGEQRLVRGKIKSLDFVDKHSVILDPKHEDDSSGEGMNGYPW